jgi:hypothetical protein
LRAEKELNKEVYAGNVYRYISAETTNTQKLAKCDEYQDEKEKNIQLNRVKKRIIAGIVIHSPIAL